MSRILLLVISFWLVAAFAADQDNTTSSQVEQIQSRLETLGPNEEGNNRELRESYQQALKYLSQQQEYASRASQLNLLITEFSQRSRELEQQVENYRPETIAQLQSLTVAQLEQQLSINNAKLLELKNNRDRLITELSQIDSRRLSVPELLAKLRGQQEQLVESLAQESLDKGEQTVVARVLAESQLEMIKTQMRMLELELLSSRNQQSLNKKRITLLDTQIEDLTRLTMTLQERLAELRRQETEKAVTASQQLTEVGQDSHPLIQQQAAINVKLSVDLRALASEVGQAIEGKALAEQQSRKVSNNLKRIKNQLQWLKVSSSFGQTLRAELASLPPLPDIDALIDRLGKAQFATYDLEQQAELLSDSDRYLAELTASVQQPLTSAQRQTLHSIIQARLQLVQGLLDSYRGLLSEMAQQEVATQELYNQILQFRNLIDEHLLWVPNTGPINLERFALLQRNISWLTALSTWQQVPTAISQQPWGFSLLLGSACVFLAVWLFSRRRLSHLHAEYAPFVGKVTLDRFGYTAHLFLAAAGYALALPLFMQVTGRMLLKGQGLVFANGLGQALLWLSWVAWLWLMLKDLSRPKGFLVGHLQWNATTVRQWLRQLRRLMWFSVPLMMLISVAEAVNTEAMRATLGRASFVALCLGISLFFARTRREQGLLDSQPLSDKTQRVYNLIWSLLILAPLAFGGLALYGYLYTGLTLLVMVLYSLLIAAGLIMVYSLSLRGLLVQERRIAFEQAKARRAEILAQRAKEEDGSSEPLTELPDEHYLDLKSISDQSRGLVKSLLWIAFAASLWALWSPLFSALEFLDSITVWESAFTLKGVEQIQPISLKALLLSIAILLFIWISVRNLPGVMQLLVLQHLSLSPGTGYAVTTLLNYSLVLIGILVSFNILGFDWSKLQWLVAALGVGLGFGLQEIFANFISGLIILFEKPIRIGDTVTINGLTGTVSKIQIRATTIIDWDRKEIIVPNKSFITDQLVNWSLSDQITRVIINIGVAYGSDNRLVERLLLQAAEETPQVLKIPKADAFFVGFGNSTLNYELRVYVDEMADRLPVAHALHNLIDEKFREHKVEIAFPQLDVHLKRA